MNRPQISHLDAALGASEERESRILYGERATERQATTRRAKSTGGAICSADWQVSAVRICGEEE